MISRSRLILVAGLTVLSACDLRVAPATCVPEDCAGGCCAEGVCTAGTDVAACGVAGNRCEVCGSGQRCAAGRCVEAAPDGGLCTARSDAALCAGMGKACGPLRTTDECNVLRDIASCGSCPGNSPCSAAGSCGCVGETDAELCSTNHAACGQIKVSDRCGVLRTIASCGSCTAPRSCTGTECSCVPETPAQLCAAAGKACDSLSTTDRCGTAVTVASCGTCTAPYVCSTTGQCACPTETDAQFCARLGRACGSASGTDLCGRPRNVASCGTCAGTNACSQGVCACPGETAASFCKRQGATCGSVTGTDICGNPKSVASCGSCTGYNTCGGGTSPNTCGCTPQTDAAFCTARGKECGTLPGTDNCGLTRTATCPGTCTPPLTCGGGATSNVCGCTTESNAQFCFRLGKNCDSVTATDNCGAPRTTNCGTTCPTPQTCGGGGMANVCGCTGETDAQFCARLGKNCGSFTAADNCGRARTADCGASCPPNTVCGGGGVPNVCGGRVEPMLAVCGGGFCWDNPLPVGANLKAVKTSPSGSNWVVGDSGTVLHWNGSTWRGWFAVVPTGLSAVWPFSDTDVWVAGAGGVILHFDGVNWSPVTSSTTADLKGFWGAADGTLWVVGLNGTVLKRSPGGSFVAQTLPGGAQTSQLNAVFGLDTHVWAVGSRLILHWDGAAWTTASTNYDLTDVWAASATDVWAVSTSGVMRYTGAAWASSTATKGRAVTGTRSADVWVTGDDAAVYHFDAISWTSMPMVATTGGRLTSSLYGLAVGKADGTVLAVGEHGTLYRYNGSSWYRINKGVNPITPKEDLSTADVYASGTASTMVGVASTADYPYNNWGTFVTCAGGPCTSSRTGSGQQLSQVAGQPASSAWAVDSYSVYNLGGGSVPALPVSVSLGAVAPITDTEVWAVGGDKTLHLVGGSWAVVPNSVSGTATTLRAASVWAASQVWAAGSSGTLMRYDGANWGSVPSGVTTDITLVRATGATTALAGGAFGVISCTNTTCTRTLQTSSITGLWAESPTTFWVIQADKAKRWSGGVAQDMTPWANGSLRLSKVAGSGTKAVVMGYYGELLHQQ
jgi:hypothetical protein